MSKTNTLENEFLQLMFNNVAMAGVGDAGGLLPSAAAGSFYISLHTADPGEAGNQGTSECAYTGYARVAVARSVAGFTVSGNQVSNAALVQFGQKTAGADETAMFVGVGDASSGATKLRYKNHIGTAALPCTGKASDDIIRIPGHALAVNDRIVFYADPNATLPAGITEGTVYHVLTVTGNDITISATSGGATLDITADGAGMAGKVTPLLIANLVRPEFAIGQLVIKEY